MHGLEIFVLLAKDKRREFLQAIDSFSRRHLERKSCIQKMLFEEIGEQIRFMWVEHWTDLTAFEEYLKSDLFNSLLGTIDVLGEMEGLYLSGLKPFPDDYRKSLY